MASSKALLLFLLVALTKASTANGAEEETFPFPVDGIEDEEGGGESGINFDLLEIDGDEEDEEDGEDDGEDGDPLQNEISNDLNLEDIKDLIPKDLTRTTYLNPIQVQYKGSDKEEILNILKQKTRKNLLKGIGNGSVSRFIKYIIYDCIKDITKIIKEEQKPKPIVNKDPLKTLDDVYDFKSEFNSKIKEVYKPLVDLLDKVNNPNVDIKEIKQQIEGDIELGNLKIDSSIQFFNGTVKSAVDQLKKERELLDDYIKQFTDSVISSKCLEVRQSKLAFQKCLEKQYCEFALNVSKSVETIEKVTKEIDIMGNETKEFVEKEIEKIINETKEKVEKEIGKIKDQSNTNLEEAKKEYVQNKSGEVEKKIEEILKEKEKISEAKDRLKLTIETAIADVNATQKGLRETIRDYLNNTDIPNAIVNEYVKLKTNEIIKKANEVVEVFNKIENRVNQLENQISKIKGEYSTDIVYQKCKSSSKFVECVDSEFQNLNDKIKPLEDELKYHITDHIQQLEKELKDVTNKVLTEASEYAQQESQRIIDEAIEKQKYVTDTKEKSDEKIKKQVDPLVEEITNIVDNLTSKYDKVPDDLRQTLTIIVKQNADDPEAPLTEEDKKLIQVNINLIIEKIEEFKNKLIKEENNGTDLEGDLKVTASTTDEQYLRVQCANEWDWVTSYKTCIDVNIKPLNDKSDDVEKKLLEIIERLKENNVTTDINIKKLITEIINSVNDTTSMNRIARDENNATTSAERVNECLKTIEKRIDEEIRPLIDALFSVKDDLSQSSNQEVDAARNAINTAFLVWAETLDFYSFKNPNQSTVYKKDKTSIKTLIEQSLKKINVTIQINIDSFVSLEKEIREVVESFYKTVEEFNFATLNATCASVYSSKKNYSKCIDSECIKFNKYFDKIVDKLNNVTDKANIDFLDAKNNITKTIEEEQRKAKEKDKEETLKVLEQNNVTIGSIENSPLGQLGRFNVTPYNVSIYDIRSKALELQKRVVSRNTSGIDMLNRANNVLKLHDYAASVMCPKVSLKSYYDYVDKLINESKARASSQFPNILPYVNDLLAYADKLEAELKNEISKLQPNAVEEKCGDKKKDLYDYYVCVKVIVDSFEKYLVPSSKNALVVSQDAYYAVVNNSLLLDKWRDNVVMKEADILKNTMSPIPESIYNGTCNVTKDKALDFALTTVNSRWNRLKGPLRDTEDKVTEAAKQVLSKNYTGIVNPAPKLSDSVQFIRDALAAAQKKNASYVTSELSAVPDRLVAVGVGKFNKFVDDITKNATNALADAQASKSLSEAIYNSMNKPNLEAACYNPNATYPMTDFITCNNNLSYGFEVEIQKIQNKLDETKKLLDNINDTAGKKVLEEYAKKLTEELLAVSAQRAINIYNDNKLPIPDQLKPYVKNTCLASSTAGKVAGCVIEF